ncbi:acyl-CoA dehydrogenase type 2 domain [Hyphomonas polymorpha PS728]|uniref:Acyl-CoA dehydrogenase type 2 domain n=2 Tax=Hyphomonas polymorpha TaxID=74319 RepID=A0A062VAV8_9PROT|nr:acyl-CoA dehydrogenase type 2 domain [Hyphomonas polymorpha PS728]
MKCLLSQLHAAGRQDLPYARLLEGHVDAIQIIRRYSGMPGLADTLAKASWCGVWNADLPGAPLRIESGVVRGGKSFASGAGSLTHALVTTAANDPARVQLWLVDLQKTPPHIDRDWWQVVGMQASQTHRVSWSAVPAHALTRIGAPGDYAREPWFSGGALRYVAIHAGGIAALFDTVRTHLVVRERERDPHQLVRLARLFTAAETAADPGQPLRCPHINNGALSFFIGKTSQARILTNRLLTDYPYPPAGTIRISASARSALTGRNTSIAAAKPS